METGRGGAASRLRAMRRRIAVVAQVGIVLVAMLLAAARFVAIDATSHSASDTLRPWIIQTALIAVVAVVAVAAIGRLATARR
jgi:uncharacterized membrane protein